MDKHIRLLSRAKKFAEKCNDMKRQFGAVIVNNGKIVAAGRNRSSHPKIPKLISQKTGKQYYGLHAEISALLKCDFPVKGMVIYVHGQNMKSKKSVYSKPCELCEKILIERGINNFIFSTPVGYGIEAHFGAKGYIYEVQN